MDLTNPHAMLAAAGLANRTRLRMRSASILVPAGLFLLCYLREGGS